MQTFVNLTPEIPVNNRTTKINHTDTLDRIGTIAVKIALNPIEYAITFLPPSHSDNVPPGNVVTRYPQKNAPNK